MNILIGGQKGGGGKTTIATNIAVYYANNGIDLILLDTDKAQNSAAKWVARRTLHENITQINCALAYGDLRNIITDLSSRYELVIIDAGGSYSQEFRTALTVSDKCLIPFVPSRHDIDTLPLVNDTINQTKMINEKLTAYAIASNCPQHTQARTLRLKKNIEVFEELTDINLFSHLTIINRIAFTDTAENGLGVTEMKDKNAANEIIKVAMELYNND